jgi:hypothetical protein
LNRRSALQRVAVMMGGVVSTPALISILEGCKSPAETGAPFTLTSDQLSLVSEIAEIIIPKTDTPGAKDAGVGPFIELMIKDCYSQAQGEHFVKGLAMVQEEAQKLGGDFLSLSNEQKIEVVKVAESAAKAEREEAKNKVIDSETGIEKIEKAETPTPFFDIMKSLTLFGYFTSEPGATQALDFVPIPGKYEGCIPLKEGQKAYAL